MKQCREWIKKAWECCASPQYKCHECPIDQKKKDDCLCGQFLAQQTLAYFKSQEKKIKELTDENERLKGHLSQLKHRYDICKQNAETAKIDTVRKMQGRLNAKRGYDDEWQYNSWWGETINQIAKEMLEGEK